MSSKSNTCLQRQLRGTLQTELQQQGEVTMELLREGKPKKTVARADGLAT
jgi:hypothetical protein